jgi:hypothetical protein
MTFTAGGYDRRMKAIIISATFLSAITTAQAEPLCKSRWDRMIRSL